MSPGREVQGLPTASLLPAVKHFAQRLFDDRSQSAPRLGGMLLRLIEQRFIPAYRRPHGMSMPWAGIKMTRGSRRKNKRG
jgi:hypothetical protein